jgi:hypothetical protein
MEAVRTSETSVFSNETTWRYKPEGSSENVTWTNETKYLGVILDSKLAYKAHIFFLLHKAN